MAEATEEQTSVVTTMQSIPGLRQGGLLLGVAAAVAIGIAVALWLQSPSYRVLFPYVDPAEVGAIATVLDAAGIEHRIEPASGALSVDAAKVAEAQMLLAGQGLPQSRGVSLESLYDGNGYSTSQFMEGKFYTHALENKLAENISSLAVVKAAKVSLGIPKQSVFVRDRSEPTASVIVHLFPGRTLERIQVKAIVHLVAASVPGLNAANVTLLDENGMLLSDAESPDGLALATSQFEYKSRIEGALVENIDTLLAPILGAGRSRTRVVADIDFTELEETSERFDPQGQVLRSEQTRQESTTGTLGAVGIPGALSNQPPVAPAEPADAAAPASTTGSSLNDSTLNYEVDRTISRRRPSMGSLLRLSVAVVVDNLPAVDGAESQPLTEDKLEEVRTLVREAVGFDVERGDTLSVMNLPFQTAPEPEPAEEPPLWEQPWVYDIGKLVLAAIAGLVLLLWVVRPLLQGLLSTHKAQVAAATAPLAVAHAQAVGAMEGEVVVPEDPRQIAQNLGQTDPKRIAQVVKDWVATDD